MDQELQRIQRANDVTCARGASGQPAHAAYAGRRRPYSRHLDSMTLYQKSASSNDAYLFEEQSCQNSSRSDL